MDVAQERASVTTDQNPNKVEVKQEEPDESHQGDLIDDDNLTQYPETTVDGVTLVADKFGMYRDPVTNKLSIVKRFTWSNQNEVTVQAITYGATITKILAPDVNGRLEDIVLGYDDMEGYQSSGNQNIGCTVGRVANRIANGEFTLDGKSYKVEKNLNDKHHLHGGSSGFDKKNWVAYVEGTKVRMSLLSPDGDGGYPGDVLATVTYYLDQSNAFHIQFEATASKTTIINLTNHSYFNLAGHVSGFCATWQSQNNFNDYFPLEYRLWRDLSAFGYNQRRPDYYHW